MVANEVRDIVKRYVTLLNTKGMCIEKTFLFGSCARGEEGIGSDIDLVLVSGVFDTNDDSILAKPWRYTVEIDPRIEPVAVGLKRFMSCEESPLLELVKRDGVLIL